MKFPLINPKYYYLFLGIVMLVIIIMAISVSAENKQLANPIKLGENVTLSQICSNCTYVNVTTLKYPNSNENILNLVMTKSGSNYYIVLNSNNITQIGTYTYTTCGDYNGVSQCQPVDFIVNPSGSEMNGWTMTINIFVSLSALLLMFLFLFLASTKSNVEMAGGIQTNEKSVIRFFFMGLALVFLIAHIVVTSQIIYNTIGAGILADNYTYIMWVFFAIIILMFIYTVARLGMYEVDNFKRRVGLK